MPEETRILLLYHFKANTGYAIETLERVFWDVAVKVAGKPENVFLCYPSYEDGYPRYTPEGFDQYLQMNPNTPDAEKLDKFRLQINQNKIDVILGFDQPPSLPYYKIARRAGVSRIVSYWGAPMSSPNHGLKLWLKKMQNKRYLYQPDMYIFEAHAMRASAYAGRGIPKSRTTVCHLGVDTENFKPSTNDRYYAHDKLGIDYSQQLVFYSGHFESRKGISVIAEAANQVAETQRDITFVLFGNQPGQEQPYAKQLTAKARRRVIFGGYRDDLHRIHRSCFAGVIASTVWDSFTVSSLEMQASGLPLIVSDLPGLNETIENGVTGYLFDPGESSSLADLLVTLSNTPRQRNALSKAARERVERNFSKERQVECLSRCLRF